MKLLAEIAKQLLAEEDGASFGVQYCVIDGKGGYFQNVKSIREFSQTCIVLQGKRTAVKVSGSGLYLGKYFGGDATVLGDICSVERVPC